MFTPDGMTGILVSGGIALLCFVLGIVLYNGHGAMLIAGYNTMSPKQREKINEKALCRAVGIFLMVLGGWIVLLGLAAAIHAQWLILPLIVAMLAGAVIFVVYVKRSKRFKREA